MVSDVRCLCSCCRSDYEQAGYTVTVIHPIRSDLCDKCERPGCQCTITMNPTKKKRKRKRRRR
jgi:hypothetical protein